MGAQVYLCHNVFFFLFLFFVLVILFGILGYHRWGNGLLTGA